jgi:hypothetical protein
MWARYHLNVHSTSTGEGEATIEFGGPRNVTVCASASKDSIDTLVLIATAEFEPKDNVARVFNDLAVGVLPKDSKTYEFIGGQVEPGESLDKRVPPHHILPEYFRQFSQQVKDEMSEAARAVADIYRWRSNTYLPSRRGFSVRASEFSFDGQMWHNLPATTGGRSWLAANVGFDDDLFKNYVQPVVDDEEREPLGFELLAEAAGISATNRRGALVVAVAALEVGFKSFIADLAPHAGWLAMNVPSPSVEKMLREYLPKLPVRQPLPSGKVLPPPDKTIAVVRKAVQQRNQITHTGSETTIAFIDETLEAVKDTLRLLDYYRGHGWATTWMSYPFAVALGLRERDKQLDDVFGES